ncbi:MAG: hypothetical protein ABI818_03505 [Acidobacteriota bacterium]
MKSWLIAVALLLGQLPAAPPQAEIASSGIRAKIYLPDAQQGYYRGTRFDWAGVVASLEWNGHSYFGQWFERYDPQLHDAITGPVEEFLTGEAGLGYDEAKPGESFVRIGVGAVRKPEEPAYRRFATYDIVDPGTRSVEKGADWIEFVHELKDTGGYGYVYRKKLRLTGNSLVLEHRLVNTGRKTIATSVYNHDFFMLDRQPTGPDFVVRFPFVPRASRPLEGLVEIRGKEVVYLKPFERRQTLFTEVEGFGASPSDFDFRLENRKTGAGVRQTGDRPIAKLQFWSAGLTICPEAYIDLRIEPGKDTAWKMTYEFYQAGK